MYNNYRIYTKDKEKSKDIKKQYNLGNGSITEKEYLQKMKSIREYSNINKVEFTSFSIEPVNTLKVYFTINDVYEEEVSLDTISSETKKFIYRITNSTGRGPYYIEQKDKPTELTIPENLITYYDGGIK